MSVPLNVTSTHIHFNGGERTDVRGFHDPHFIVQCSKEGESPRQVRESLIRVWRSGEIEGFDEETVKSIGEVDIFKSFHSSGKEIPGVRVYTHRPGDVPKVSDAVFFHLGYATAEHDIPYHQRVIIDLAASDRMWMYDTRGRTERVKVLVYDLELTEYARRGGGKEGSLPIDMIGYASFDVAFESTHDADGERFEFVLKESPTDWEDREVVQLIAEDRDQEIRNILEFARTLQRYDMIAGHNILSFDNVHLRARIDSLMAEASRTRILSKDEVKSLARFRDTHMRKDRLFNFGQMVGIVDMLPTSFDTYFAARRFYFFLHDFTLKSVAPFMGVTIPDRVYLDYKDLRLDERSIRYHRQDVQECLGITMLLVQQTLPLAFIACLPLEMIWPAGTIRLWDHMAMIRAAMRKKIIPPTHRADEIARAVSRFYPGFCARRDLADRVRSEGRKRIGDSLARVVKYAEEMPPWIEYHHILPGRRGEFISDVDVGNSGKNEKNTDSDAGRRVLLPGGLTIHPDEQNTQMLIYWDIVAADVGAMYPTILRGRNIGSDTVRLSAPDEEPDEWVWLRWVPESFLDASRIKFRRVNDDQDPYAGGVGYAFGVKIEDAGRSPSMVSLAMKGIMTLISEVKRRSRELDADPGAPLQEKRKWKMMYASLKALRNAGTHGMLAASRISGRQFNLFAGGCITTEGQRIIHDVAERLEKENALVAYADTDGIYIPCSRSAALSGNALRRLTGNSGNVKGPTGPEYRICDPERVKETIRECNDVWRERLGYPEFELEIEEYDAALFVKHKNYLLWQGRGDDLEMIVKGNNFKGSDKPGLARKALRRIMRRVLSEVTSWENENEGRARLVESIISATEDVVGSLDVTSVPLEDLILVQTVRSPGSYKTVGKGKESIFTLRSRAIQELTGMKITTSLKMRFLVAKRPLPGIPKPSKSSVKPIDYMYPVESLMDENGDIVWERVDLEWYKRMVRSYIYGAFGLRRDDATGMVTSVTLDSFGKGEPLIRRPPQKRDAKSVKGKSLSLDQFM